LLLAARCPSVKLLAVTCVNGNNRVDQVLQNTLRVLDAAEAPEDVLVAKGFGDPLVEPLQPPLTFVHGSDGLGDLQPALPPSKRSPCPIHAVQVLIQVLRSASLPVTVVALGPLTNIAVAFRMSPDLWHEKCAQLVWMGGAVASGGNKAAWSEFNAGSDPEAAHIILTSGLRLLMYPWDVFLKPEITHQELKELDLVDTDAAKRRKPWSVLASRLLSSLMCVFDSEKATIGDAGALVAALLPSAMTVRKLNIHMELQGAKTRGMTVCDLRPCGESPESSTEAANANVVLDLDCDAVRHCFKKHVLSSSQPESKL